MSRRSKFLFLLLPLLFGGCATHRQVSTVQLKLDELSADQQEMKRSMARLDSLLVEQNLISRRLNADFNTGMEEIQQKMSQIESRLADAGELVKETVGKIETKSSSSGIGADTAQTGNVDADRLYRAAYLDLTRGDYKMAIKGFEEFLARYPQTAKSDNALYWIGECYYTQKDYTKSQSIYERLLKDYPDSEKIAAAKYKLGMSLYNQKLKTKAKQYFQDVIKDYPGTDEAKQAAEMLSRY